MTINTRRRVLLRQLEAALRKCGRAEDIRWELRQQGMTVDQIRAYETSVRRRIRDERCARQHPSGAPRREIKEHPSRPARCTVEDIADPGTC